MKPLVTLRELSEFFTKPACRRVSADLADA
jgi:hypothetical protein